MNDRLKKLVNVIVTTSAIAVFGAGVVELAPNAVVNAKQHVTKKKHAKKQAKKASRKAKKSSKNTKQSNAAKKTDNDSLDNIVIGYNDGIYSLSTLQSMDDNVKHSFFVTQPLKAGQTDPYKDYRHFPHSYKGITDSASSLIVALQQLKGQVVRYNNDDDNDYEEWANDVGSLKEMADNLNLEAVPSINKKVSIAQQNALKKAYKDNSNEYAAITRNDGSTDNTTYRYNQVQTSIDMAIKYLQSFAKVVGSIK